jgi:hypothetical protein
MFELICEMDIAPFSAIVMRYWDRYAQRYSLFLKKKNRWEAYDGG